MKIVELQPEEFDDLARMEPNYSFYQTSKWANYYSSYKYKPLYLAYKDDSTYHGFAMLLVEKGKFLSSDSAVCPFGFLINYFDTELLKDFIVSLKKYLLKKHIKKLTITPNIKYLTTRGNNDLLIKNLISFGFVKDGNTYEYSQELIKKDKVQIDSDIVIKTFIIDDNTKSLLNTDQSNLYDALGDDVKFIACKLDSETTIMNLQDSIDKAQEYIDGHQDSVDTEYEDNLKKLSDKQDYLQIVSQAIKENGVNPVLATTCLIDFNHKLTQLFIDIRNYELLKVSDLLDEAVFDYAEELGYTTLETTFESASTSKNELLGKFTCQL